MDDSGSDIATIKESLASMGFGDQYVSRAIAVHEKSKRGTNYDIAWLIEIIARLKSKDKSKKYFCDDQVEPFRGCFSSMEQVLGAIDLQKGKTVDYRYENGRFLLCEIEFVRVNNHQHFILSLHPMGVSVTNKKHDRLCNLFYEYHRIRLPKSASLRSIASKNHNMASAHIDAYVDINPIHRQGHEGWKHGRIIKMDTNSSQVKVFYHNDKDHYNYSYWFHLEDSMEIAPFKSMVKDQQGVVKRDSGYSMIALSEISEMEEKNDEDEYDDMYTEIKSNHQTPQNSTPATPVLCPHYSSDHHGAHLSHFSYSHASMHSIDHHSDHEHGHHDADYKQNESMLHQLSAFGYDAEDIKDAMEHVSNPSDINQIVEYLSKRDMKKLSESAKSFHVKPVNEWKSNKMTPYGDDSVPEKKPSLVQSASETSPQKLLFADLDDEKSDSESASDLFDEYQSMSQSMPTISKHNVSSQSVKTIFCNVSPLPSSVPSLSKSQSVFGADSILMQSTFVNSKDYGVPIPNILIKLKEALFANRGHLICNVFDIKANNNQCQQIQSCLNDEKLKTVDLRRMDVVVIGNLIKGWFESLPKRILKDVDVGKVKKCKNIHDAAEIIKNDIGEPNESYFKWLLDFCADLLRFEKVNKMSVKYLAMVFGPTLFDDDEHFAAVSTAKFVQLSILYRHFQNQ